MTRIAALLVAAGAWLAGSSARAEEGRFDAQVFRPSAAPRDLVMVRKSEVIGTLSPVVGLFSDLGFDPLVLVNKSTNQAINAVAARLTLTPMAGIGLFNWVDVTVAVPLVAWQYGGNLRGIGTEGPVKSIALGDMRLSTRVSLPYLNRKDEVKRGFGMALAGDVNLPTGSMKDFTSDGVVTGGPRSSRIIGSASARSSPRTSASGSGPTASSLVCGSGTWPRSAWGPRCTSSSAGASRSWARCTGTPR